MRLFRLLMSRIDVITVRYCVSGMCGRPCISSQRLYLVRQDIVVQRAAEFILYKTFLLIDIMFRAESNANLNSKP